MDAVQLRTATEGGDIVTARPGIVFCSGIVAYGLQGAGQGVQDIGRVGMVRAHRLFHQSQRPSGQGRCLGVLALGLRGEGGLVELAGLGQQGAVCCNDGLGLSWSR